MPGLLRSLRRKPCWKKLYCHHTSGDAMACLAGLMAAEPPWEPCCISLRSPWTRYCPSLLPPSHCCQLFLPVLAASSCSSCYHESLLLVGPVIAAASLATCCQNLLGSQCCQFGYLWLPVLGCQRHQSLLPVGLVDAVNSFSQCYYCWSLPLAVPAVGFSFCCQLVDATAWQAVMILSLSSESLNVCFWHSADTMLAVLHFLVALPYVPRL